MKNGFDTQLLNALKRNSKFHGIKYTKHNLEDFYFLFNLTGIGEKGAQRILNNSNYFLEKLN